MPPKKKEVAEPKPLLGRFGTSLKVGIVGIPNVGKSTFFNVLCQQSAAAENYPFCTIDPNESRCPVPDERFDWLVEHWKPASKVPAFLNVVDIAGLVKGASEGAGLGNAFLSHISGVDGILHMVRAFDSKDVTHVDGEVDPVRDMETIHEELRLKDVDQLKKFIEAKEKIVKRDKSDKKALAEFEIMKKVETWLETEKKDVRSGTWNNAEIEVLNSLLLLTSKPVIYLVNLTESDYIKKKNKWLPKIKEYIDSRNVGDLIIPWSGELEQKLFDMGAEKAAEYCKANSCQSALPKIIKAAFKGLNLQYFFTAGEDEVRAWTIRVGDKAPEAAGKIHTDFERGFIMAEVMKFDDYKELGSEAAVKAAGKYQQQGKNYIVHDGDIIFFKFNVTTQAKKK